MQTDLTAVAASQDIDQIRVQLELLQLQPGDVLIVRRSDAFPPVPREEAKRVRQAVLKAFEGHPFKPAILFADGYELAVVHGK